MAICTAQVRVTRLSGTSEDDVTNTWWFDLTTPDSGGTTDVEAAMKSFYNAWSTSRSTHYAWNTATIKWYDQADPEPRAPFRSALFALTQPSGTSGATPELCMCLSFKGSLGSGLIAARRRGRLYLGPLGMGALDAATGHLAAATITTTATAAGVLLAASGNTDWEWIIHSRTAGTTTSVHEGWIDNAVDIQRRRGLTATTRTTFGP